MPRILGLLTKFDWLLMGAVFILIAFGMAAIYSVALSTKSGDLSFIDKQVIAAAIGVVILVALALSNYRQFRNWTLPLYIFAVLLLIAVLIFGTEINGTKGWFQLAGFSFQPVEFVKIVLVLVFAKYFSEKARRQFGWSEILGSGFLVSIPVALVIQQPDYGSAAALLGLWAVLLFFAGIKWKHALVVGSVAAVAIMIAWFGLFQDYQRERVLTFFDPSRDALGRGYNVTQAIIAVGSGQLFGKGLGFGSQSQLKFLPESQTDFIFAVIAEELGFVGILFILAAFGLLFYRLFKLVRRSHDDFTSYLLLGITAVLAIQVIVNIGMNLGLLPVTGLGLPLVSYGGSSLIMGLILIGLAESVAVRTRTS